MVGEGKLRINVRLLGAALLGVLAIPESTSLYASSKSDSRLCEDAMHGDKGLTVALLTHVIDSGTTSEMCYLYRGVTFRDAGHLDQAINDISHAIELNPQWFYGYALRAAIDLGTDRLDQALSDCAVILKGNKIDSDCHAIRGVVLFRLRRYSDALPEFDAALKHPETYTNDHLNALRGMTLVNLGRYADAMPSLDFGVSAEHLEPLTRFYRGLAEWKLEQLDKARADASVFLEVQPRMTILFSGEHSLEMFDITKRQDLRNAAITSAQVAEASKDSSAAFAAWNRAYYYNSVPLMEDGPAIQSTIESGIGAAYRRLEVKPPTPELVRQFNVQAETYFDEKQYQDAIGAYGTVVSIAPWYALAYFNMAVLEGERLKMYKRAVDHMRKYLQLEPNAHDARQAQDKIYEWQAKAK